MVAKKNRKRKKAYNPQRVVGNFFEPIVMNIFQLAKSDSEDKPDLVSPDGSFYMEVKASSFKNGGVVKANQLWRYDQKINARRFYAFPFHLATDIQDNYHTARALRQALSLRSLYIMPFSVVRAYFQVTNKKQYPYGADSFVLMRESLANKIFTGEREVWDKLGLDKREYKMTQPHGRVYLITRNGNLENELLASFHPEFV